ncbi:hypothetical protein [Serratia fonticola]|uniref:hypothetical protein n=1 Tax=Serratia fonticola TaxID=47917 RepID=UPI0034C66E31
MNKIGVFSTSKKKFENRIPFHPSLFHLIPDSIKKNMYFESGYGKRFGINDEFFSIEFGGVLSRDEIFYHTDIWVLPKPEVEDFKHFSPGKVLWGWPHCVQGVDIASAAIKAKMTIVAWEAMYSGNDNTHVFYRNNELAGYAAIQHMMMLTGKSGYFGKNLKAAVLGFGATGRGAVNSLKSLGVKDITIYSRRPSFLISAPIESVDYNQMKVKENGEVLLQNEAEYLPTHNGLSECDIIVNCVLQNPTSPLMFITEENIQHFKKRTDIVDISCDKGMGFYFAKPTSFDEPTFCVPNNEHISYYCVDHTPTIYWDSASYEITKSLLSYLPLFINDDWRNDKTLAKAVEIDNGVVINKKIISFQKRDDAYPHEFILVNS